MFSHRKLDRHEMGPFFLGSFTKTLSNMTDHNWKKKKATQSHQPALLLSLQSTHAGDGNRTRHRTHHQVLWLLRCVFFFFFFEIPPRAVNARYRGVLLHPAHGVTDQMPSSVSSPAALSKASAVHSSLACSARAQTGPDAGCQGNTPSEFIKSLHTAALAPCSNLATAY